MNHFRELVGLFQQEFPAAAAKLTRDRVPFWFGGSTVLRLGAEVIALVHGSQAPKLAELLSKPG